MLSFRAMGRNDGPASYQQSFQPVPESAGAARGFARGALSELGLGDMEDRVCLLIGEMSVNAILHARTSYSILITRPAEGTVRVEVHDGNRVRPRQKTALTVDPLTYGRGLVLIEATSDRWGVDDTEQGKVIWAEVDA